MKKCSNATKLNKCHLGFFRQPSGWIWSTAGVGLQDHYSRSNFFSKKGGGIPVSFMSQLTQFLNTPIFGVLSMIFVGGSWCFVGAIAGKAPKRGIPMEYIIFSGSVASMIGMGIIMAVLKTDLSPLFWLTTAVFFCAGIGCSVQHKLTSVAMQSGPNNIIWAITQSAMVFPFIVSVAFFGVKLTVLRLIGIILMLAALAVFGATGKSSPGTAGKWKLVTFICLGVVSVEQIIITIPFFYPEAAKISPLYCTFLMMAGYAVCSTILFIHRRRDREYINGFFNSLKSPVAWKYSFWLLPVSSIIAFLCQFPGMKVMAEHGLGGMSCPLMVGSCIVMFSIFTTISLKEKFRAIQVFALACCITGLFLICTNADDNKPEIKNNQVEKI